MQIKKVHLAVFSPCRTTLTAARAIAAGFSLPVTEHDLTLPGARAALRQFGPDDLVIIAFPVYGGRLPHNADQIFAVIRGENTPAVLTAVYGNRAYEDALLEMRHEAKKRGFVAVAAASPVAEHCMAPDVAANRPDDTDITALSGFGRAVAGYLAVLGSVSEARVITPGEFPYRKEPVRANAAPRGTESCTRCGTCVPVCPTGAIAAASPETATDAACILCMACIKACPEGARKPTHATFEQAATWLRANCKERKEPEFFLGTLPCG